MLNKELVAASSKPLVLSILAQQGESYGYEIIQQIRMLSGGEIEWSDGMLYPVLHRMEKENLLTSTWKVSETGRKRKYYRLNEKGKLRLNKEKQQWAIVNTTLTKLWEVSYV